MTLNCNGRLVDLKTPKVMGIVNATPDSFYDGGSLKNEKALLLKVEQMISEGTTFLDVGGYSSRPGASDIPESEELKRVLP
ncbi:MAG: dihydropteroate synthase, partial [Flavobacteriaceae bacterium]